MIVAMVAAFTLYLGHPAFGSDHQDSPTVVGNPLADITDVFAFPDPANASNVVLAMDVDPLIPSGMSGTAALDPNVLYQFKIANGLASNNYNESMVIQLRATGTGPTQTITMYGPSTPNEVSTTNTLVASTGTFAFGQNATLPGGIQAFVGPRRDPFFFDLAQFFKIVPDRNYKNQPTPPAATATSFNFSSAAQPIVLNGTSFGTAGTNGCVIGTPSDILVPYNVLTIVVELPKTMLEPSGQPLGKIGLWATTSTPDGLSE